MRVEVLRVDRLRLVRTVAVVALTALGAGCSADISRFDDGFYTGAVPNKPMPQASVGASQAFPGSVDRTRTASVNASYGMPSPAGGAVTTPGEDSSPTYAQARAQAVGREAPIQRTMLAPPSADVSDVQPVSAEPRPYAPPVRDTSVGEPAREASVAAKPAPTAMKAGWNRSGASVTLRPGETIDTLSNRYGVPTKAILAANGLKSVDQAAAGQAIEIPTYSYGDRPMKKSVASAAPTLGASPQPLRDPSPAKVANATPGSVTVGSGDSLAAIARRSGVSVAQLRAANNLSNDNIRTGQKLVLPTGASEPKRVASLDPKEGTAPKTVMKPAGKAVAETADKQPKADQSPQPAKAAAATKPVAEPKTSAAAAPTETAAAKPAAPATTINDESEKEAAAAPAGTGIDQLRWPVQGRVIKRFGEKDGARRNDGLDISVPRGTPVKAAENGVVIYAGDGLKEFGNTVLVRHDNGLVTVYGHADDLKVKRGETVRRGQDIATAGMSGDAQSPMVHFEVRKNSAPVDPGKFLQ